MSAPKHREVGCAIIIGTCRRFLLQQRDDVPGILCPGGVETFLQCVVHLASYSGVDPDAEGGTLRGEFFVARDVPADALLITEGSLLITERDDALPLMRRLAPSAQFAMSTFLKNQWHI